LAPETTELREISLTQKNCHYAIQCHSVSLISVPIERTYMRIPITEQYQLTYCLVPFQVIELFAKFLFSTGVLFYKALVLVNPLTRDCAIWLQETTDIALLQGVKSLSIS